jgi:hypothetical protein
MFLEERSDSGMSVLLREDTNFLMTDLPSKDVYQKSKGCIKTLGKKSTA